MSMMLPQGPPPPGLASLIAHGAGGGPGSQDDGTQDGGLSCLQDVISGMPRLLHELTDPSDVAMATQALGILTKIQQSLMGRQQGQPNGQRQ